MKAVLRAVLSSRGLGIVGFALLVSGTLLAASARFSWVGEMVANLRWQIGEGGLLAALLLLLARMRWTSVAALALALVHLAPALRLEFGRGVGLGNGPTIAVATVNLWCLNEDGASARRWLEHDRPDVVACFEVGEYWSHALPELSDLYPYQVVAPSTDLDRRRAAAGSAYVNEDRHVPASYEPRWGMAVLSRSPFENMVIHGLPESPDPYFELDLVRQGTRFHLVGLHPERPGNAHRNARRDALLAHVARATSWTETSILVGDLNATVYSPAFGDLLDIAGLRDSRAGFGRQPTWNPPLHVGGRWLDLDHVLVRPGLVVLDRRLGPDIGSDHLPVIATIRAR